MRFTEVFLEHFENSLCFSLIFLGVVVFSFPKVTNIFAGSPHIGKCSRTFYTFIELLNGTIFKVLPISLGSSSNFWQITWFFLKRFLVLFWRFFDFLENPTAFEKLLELFGRILNFLEYIRTFREVSELPSNALYL